MYHVNRDNEVELIMSKSDYEYVLLGLGTLAGSFMRDGDKIAFRKALEVANRINEGNPNWNPYAIESFSAEHSR